MAKDVSNKTTSNTNTDDSTTSTISDQQKVPPLRIVLNTSGNQKSSTATTLASSNQQQQPQTDAKQSEKGANDNVVKTGGRVRIKLGTNKQNNSSGKTGETADDSQSKQTKQTAAIEKQQQQETSNISQKDEPTTNYSHLRRITRRSQRSAQTINNEDEESISSMTSTDENQNTTNNSNSDNNNSQDTLSTTIATVPPPPVTNNVAPATPNTSNNNNTNSSSNNNCNNSTVADQPRKYKRRKGETSESQSSDLHDGPFSYQNYKLPNQNSFELFRNIRKQVDKKMKNLINTRPKTTHGFRDYIMNRGAYLLDGNKLGNGTNLYMSEEGGLHTAPVGKYHALTRHNRIAYSVPNRAKVPLGIPINSPLYNLFIEQEKERYKMRIQHIKEREKLTLAAEQEMIRVYNQASRAAVDQLEPFSACTMLKHQEIYNYMDSDGTTILSNDDARQDQGKQPENTSGSSRTRHREQISPSRNTNTNSDNNSANVVNNNIEESTTLTNTQDSSQQKDATSTTNEMSNLSKGTTEVQQIPSDSETIQSVSNENKTIMIDDNNDNEKILSNDQQKSVESESKKSNSELVTTKEDHKILEDDENKPEIDSNDNSKKLEDKKLEEEEEEKTKETLLDSNKEEENTDFRMSENKQDKDDVKLKEHTKSAEEVVNINPNDKEEKKTSEFSIKNDDKKDEIDENEKQDNNLPKGDPEVKIEVNDDHDVKKTKDEQNKSDIMNVSVTTEIISEYNPTNDSKVNDNDKTISMELDGVDEEDVGKKKDDTNDINNADMVCLSDDDRKAYNKSIFLSQLQEIDDKWEKVRNEMLIRHRNEAESLHAVQKLEWEWKTKEIGACDVRTTPVIDNSLVPKLNVYTQDY